MGYKEAYEKSKKSGALKDLKPEFKKWEKEGEFIIGRFKHRIHITSTMSPEGYEHYVFDTDEGVVKFPLSGYNDKEIGSQLVPGHVYYIEYKGKEKLAAGNEMKVFDAQEVKDVEGLETVDEDIPF